jgi:hypothetical protein
MSGSNSGLPKHKLEIVTRIKHLVTNVIPVIGQILSALINGIHGIPQVMISPCWSEGTQCLLCRNDLILCLAGGFSGPELLL